MYIIYQNYMNIFDKSSKSFYSLQFSELLQMYTHEGTIKSFSTLIEMFLLEIARKQRAILIAIYSYYRALICFYYQRRYTRCS